MTLSGGMKRRVMIAKALAHEPGILFLDEPTAGVDVELRRHMWEMVRGLRQRGVTIILTTHYIDEAEEMADRVGVINKGEIILVEDKATLMQKLGKKQLTLQLQSPLDHIPEELAKEPLELLAEGNQLVYTFDARAEQSGIAGLLRRLGERGIDWGPSHQPKLARGNLRPASSGRSHERLRNSRDLRLRNVAHLSDPDAGIASPVLSTSLYFIVFGFGRRLAHGRDRRRPLRRLHRARLDDAVHLTEHLERLLRHLHAEVLRHDLRDVVRPDLRGRDPPRVRGRRRHTSVLLGAIILATARLFVPFSIAHPLWMAFPRLDVGDLQPLPDSSSDLGRRFRKAAARAMMIVTRFTFLGGFSIKDAATDLAEDHPVQPGGLSGRRLPMELTACRT